MDKEIMRDTGYYFIYNNYIHKKCIIFKRSDKEKTDAIIYRQKRG